MGRVFTIDFSFRGRIYHAFVRMRSTHDQYYFQVNTNNPELQQLLPDDTIQYRGREEVNGSRYPNTDTNDLIAAIAAAIEDHLEHHDID